MKSIKFSLPFAFVLLKSMSSYAQCTDIYDLGGTDGANATVNGITVTYNEGGVNGGLLGANAGEELASSGFTSISTSSVASISGNGSVWNQYVWQKVTFSQEVEVTNAFKMVDIDGGSFNNEMAGVFARNAAGTQINPSMTCGSETTLGTYTTPNDIVGITIGPVQTCVSKENGPLDTDNPAGFATADFGTTKVKELYFMFGISGNTSGTFSQTSGVSNICFETFLCEANAPTMVAATNSTICEGASSSLSGTCQSGETIRWYSADSSTSTLLGSGSPFVVSPTSDSTYYAFCYSAASSCTSINSTPVTVNVNSPTITDIITPTCTASNEGLIAFQTSGGATSSVTVDKGYTAIFDSDGRYNDARQVWVVEQIASLATINVMVTESGCTSSESYTMPDCAVASPFPVKIIDFKAVQLADDIAIEWIVAEESSILNFEVLKSNNAVNFEAIGRVKALNQDDKHQYSFFDKKEYGKTAYYKLAINEEDGSSSFTKIIAVNVEPKDSYLVYPVPAAADYLLVETLSGQEIETMNSLNSIGVLQNLNFKKVSSDIYEIDTRKLQNGVYLLEIDNGISKERRRIVIQK